MFDGKFKSRREVSLGGKKRSTTDDARTKEDFLRKARMEREEREKLRQDHKRSVVVQKLWRGFQVRQRLYHQMQQQYTKKIHDIAHVRAMLSSSTPFQLPRQVLIQLIREFNFFSQNRRMLSNQTDSFIELVVLLLLNAKSNFLNANQMAESSYMALLVSNNPSDCMLYIVQMTKILSFCFEYLRGVDQGWFICEKHTYDMILETLELFSLQSNLLPETFRTETNDKKLHLYFYLHEKSSCMVLENLLSMIRLGHCTEENKMFSLLVAITKDTLAMPSRGICPALRTFYEASYARMAQKMLVEEGIVKHKMIQRIVDETLGNNQMIWQKLISSLQLSQHLRRREEDKVDAMPTFTLTELKSTQKCALISNLLVLGNTLELSPDLANTLVYVLYCLLDSNILHSAFPPSKKHLLSDESTYDTDAMDVDESQEDLDNPSIESIAKCLSRESFRRYKVEASTYPSLAGKLNEWIAPTFVAQLFDRILSLDPLTNDQLTLQAIARLCSMYSKVLVDFHGIYASSAATQGISFGAANHSPVVLSLLNTLAFSFPENPLLIRLWRLLAKHSRGPKIHASSSSSSLTSSSSSLTSTSSSSSSCSIEIASTNDEAISLDSCFVLVFAGLTHFFLTIDDESFLDANHHLSTGELQDLVEFLRDLLFRLYWIDADVLRSPYQPTSMPFCLLVSGTRLFNSLYERNNRLGFCIHDKKHHHHPSTTSSSSDSSISSSSSWLWSSSLPLRDMAEKELSLNVFGKASRLASILTSLPQVLSFDQRVAIFEDLLKADKQSVESRQLWFGSSTKARIRRECIVEDSFKMFDECRQQDVLSLKNRFQVTLFNEQGLEEPGIDGGGVFKEFMDTLTKAAFDPQYALFLETEDQLLYPNPSSHFTADNHLEQFEFLGMVLGKAVYEGILVEPQFAGFFLRKLLGKSNSIDDLQSLDTELYHHIMSLKRFEGDVKELCLTFAVVQNEFGESAIYDLIPNGRSIEVTNENRFRYMHLLSNYKLNIQTSIQCVHFLRGFRYLIPSKWINMFNATELQILIGGSNRGINVDDWKANTNYSGGYHPIQPMIQWFWEIVFEFSMGERESLLKFITSCSRAPLLGFKRLEPQICIQLVRTEDGDDRLPSSATCMNLLKLPTYSSKEILRNKLLYAISSNAGFELS